MTLSRTIQIYNRLLFLTFLLIFITIGCKKKSEYPIPNVSVNIYLNLSLPAYQNLNSPSGWVYINGGSRGIIVYRNFNTFIALDRHTTYQPDSVCGVATVDTSNFFIINDPCSDSQYSISDGTVSKGPAKWGLKPYFANYDGGSVHISN